MPKLSIIIPVYNASAYLEQTLDSVLNQSLTDIEVIAVDDGSTDGSPDILRQYARKDPRVRVLRQKNRYAGVARNAGLAVATGEYIHFLDADDYVLDYAYEAIYSKAVKYDLDCLKFASLAYDVSQAATVDQPLFTLTRLRPGDFNRLLTPEADSPLYKISVVPWNGIYRRSFLNRHDIRFSPLFCVNDRSFYCRVMTNAARIMISRDRLVMHRVNLSDSLIGVRAQHFECHFQSIGTVSDQLIRDRIDPVVAQLVIKREFTDLFVWYRKFFADPLFGEAVRRETKRFVREYEGLHPELLSAMYQAALDRLSRDEPPAAPPPPDRVMRTRCPNPRVSVVLPIRDAEAWLNEALYSLSVQTLSNMEFICVNDGSTDGSMAIVREYANLDKRFVLLDSPGKGYGKAMNRGIDAAAGEYLGVLDPHDFVSPDLFISLYRVAHREQADLVQADFYLFSVNPDGSLNRDRIDLSQDRQLYGRIVEPWEEPSVLRLAADAPAGLCRLSLLNRERIRYSETSDVACRDDSFRFKVFSCLRRAWFVHTPYYHRRRVRLNVPTLSVGEMYRATEEYRLIRQWLEQYPDRLERFAPAFCCEKFVRCMDVYRRIGDGQRHTYLHHIRDEFKGPLEAGLLEERLLGPSLWKHLNEIVADPDAYFETIRVSVILPVYNEERRLRRCLDSVLAQPGQRIEVICVDDGSTDRSPEILREYRERDSRVVVLTQANAGTAAARNNGMKIARGQYLSFPDVGDLFGDNMLEAAYERAHSEDSDIVVFRCDLYSEGSGQSADAQYAINDSILPETRPFAGADIDRDIFRAFMGWSWDKLFRADFVRSLGLQFQEQRADDDMLFVFSALVRAKRISTVNDVLAHHRQDNGGLSVRREKSWDCFYHALCALRRQLTDWELFRQYERDFVNYSLHCALWNLDSLAGPAYYLLFEQLQTGWLADLGVTAHDEYYFYQPAEYGEAQFILSHSANDYLFRQLELARTRANSMQAARDRAKSSLSRRKKTESQLKTRAAQLEKEKKRSKARIAQLEAETAQFNARTTQLEEEKKHSRARIAQLEKEKKQSRARIAQLEKEKKKLNTLLDASVSKQKQMRSSLSWKIGRIITWPVRTLKKLLKRK